MNLIKIIICAMLLAMPATISAEAADMKGWVKALVKQVRKYQKYPRSAMNREIEGKALVRVVFNADGSVASHEVLKSTGAKVLDREIPKVLGKLKLPPLPEGKASFAIKVPFSWVLG